MTKTVVGIGEVLWDMLPDYSRLGGAPANFAFHASQFGNTGYAVSAVGNDALGRVTLTTLEGKHLSSIMPRVNYPTGTVQVTLHADGIPSYEIKTGVAWDNIPFTTEMAKLAHRTSAVCFGSLAQRSEVSRATIYKFLDAMPAEDHDVLKVFDINLRQKFYSREVIEESLRRCNILKINDEEIAVVDDLIGIEGKSAEDKCQSILEQYGLKAVIFTCGVNGSHVFAPGVHSFQPTPKVKVVDTVGAGDSFGGSFCASLLRGDDIKHAHEIAVKVSAFVCTQAGAMPTLPPDLIK